MAGTTSSVHEDGRANAVLDYLDSSLVCSLFQESIHIGCLRESRILASAHEDERADTEKKRKTCCILYRVMTIGAGSTVFQLKECSFL
jgi:hypothetical protein